MNEAADAAIDLRGRPARGCAGQVHIQENCPSL